MSETRESPSRSSPSYPLDCVVTVGRIAPSVPWRRVSQTIGGCSRSDVSTGGLVLTPEGLKAYRSDGTVYATYPRVNNQANDFRVGAAGARFVIEERDLYNLDKILGVYLWYPGGSPQRLPNNYVPVGRLGVGWLGARLDKFCWKTASADHPYALRTPKLCSMAKPLLSPDGTRGGAGAVRPGPRCGHAYERDGERGDAAGDHGVGAGHPGSRPAAWETADSYLINARYDGALALVRCSASTGLCNRAARSYVRTGVSAIVTERDSGDAVTVG